MIAEAAIGFYLAGVPVISRAVSGTAEYVAMASERSRDTVMNSLVLGQPFQKSINELKAVVAECRTSNWDGYNAYPVAADTYDFARQFLQALPLYSAPTSIGAEPDGHLTLEWHKSSRWLLSLSISPEGMLYYAALFGSSKQYGSEPFLGNVPQQILNLINRVATA
jgi:hypothetical protein